MTEVNQAEDAWVNMALAEHFVAMLGWRHVPGEDMWRRSLLNMEYCLDLYGIMG